ncbi:unnamed protein product [Brassica oleracea var. botrytis]|uniref:(rape) hypothetical protein n=1 Tax=Brassica napus TaxID=3708 RepID=A0A816I070_BRANA|nr:unnamed protein product [Brassica napus]
MLYSTLLCCVFPFQLKRWERKKCKPNSLPILHKMHVKLESYMWTRQGQNWRNQ